MELEEDIEVVDFEALKLVLVGVVLSITELDCVDNIL